MIVNSLFFCVVLALVWILGLLLCVGFPIFYTFFYFLIEAIHLTVASVNPSFILFFRIFHQVRHSLYFYLHGLSVPVSLFATHYSLSDTDVRFY